MPNKQNPFVMAPLQPSDRAKRYYARILGPGKILVIHDKHGAIHFSAQTLEEFCAAALSLLDDRYGPDGYWGKIQEYIDEYQGYVNRNPPEVTVEEMLEKMPQLSENSTAVQDLKKQWKEHNADIEGYKRELAEYEAIKKAIEERDGLAAAQVLNDRQGHEYERWSLETLRNPLVSA
jgi:hypothetical protein